MRLIRPSYLLAILLFVWLPACLPAKADNISDDPEAVSLYARGKRLMREGEWLPASRLFQELSGRFPDSPNRDLFLYNRARCHYHFGDLAAALAAFGNFHKQYPQSPLIPYVEMFEGNIAYQGGDLVRALRSYIDAFAGSTEARLSGLLRRSIVGLVSGAERVQITASDFSAIPREPRCELMRQLADTLLTRGEVSVAEDLLTSCRIDFDRSHYSELANDRSRKINIAFVLPFSGELQAFGEEIYNGGVIAADLYRQESGRELKLTKYDTKGDPVDAARILGELSRSAADVVIGPLTSEEAAVAAATLSCSDLPLVAPAATQAGLTRLGETAFQLSPNVELQGVEMAEYAAQKIGADSAAVITSTDPDHLRMTRAFTERFRQLGGTVVAVEYYRTRDRDFGAYIQDIKRMLLGVPPDSAVYINDSGDTLDLDGVPAHVDCLFLPGKASQLRLLLPQVRFYNLQAAYLGSDGWGDDELYRLGDDVTQGGVFPTPFLHRGGTEAYLVFSAAYDTRYGEQPQRLARLGYDAVRLVTQAIDSGGSSRAALVEALAAVHQYEGAAGRVSFGKYRENVAMPLYRIENGRAEFLGSTEPAASAPADDE